MGLLGLVRLLFIGALVYFGVRFVRGLLESAARSPGQRRSDPWARYERRRTRPGDAPSQASAASSTPHEILGVSPGASQEEIRAAYQQLVQQYHPDRVAGLGPELRELAEKRTKEINSAYGSLRRR